jgi:hypothetical protein
MKQWRVFKDFAPQVKRIDTLDTGIPPSHPIVRITRRNDSRVILFRHLAVFQSRSPKQPIFGND